MMVRKILLWILLATFPTTGMAQFGFHAGSHMGFGRMGSLSGRAPDRGMGTFDLQFMPGYRTWGLMGGLMLDYRFMSQLADEREAGGTDYSGRGFLWGLAVVFEPGLFKFLAGYDFRARHWFSGPDTTFKGSGFRLLAGYRFLPAFSFDLQYVTTTYNSQEVNGLASGLNNDNLHHWNLGLGVSYSY